MYKLGSTGTVYGAGILVELAATGADAVLGGAGRYWAVLGGAAGN